MSSQVEQIKSRLNVVEVVSTYLKLQKAGINLKANCPFHTEKTPSFFVSPTRDSWHCFGCNKGGDIFNFVMEIEGVEFPEALKILADRAGVELRPVDREYQSERVRLLKLMEEAKKFYESGLKKNKDDIEYLKSRGLKGETAKNFGVGFAQNEWRDLCAFLKGKKYSDSEIEKSGMSVKSDRGYYDRFRNRIMFPIANSSGQVRQTIAEAKAYRTKVVESAKANADYLAKLLPEYRKRPKLVLERIYQEAMEEILSNTQETIIAQPGSGFKNTEFRIMVNRDPMLGKDKKQEKKE